MMTVYIIVAIIILIITLSLGFWLMCRNEEEALKRYYTRHYEEEDEYDDWNL